MAGPVADFVRKHIGLRLSEIHTKPQFLYCTWSPFGDRISEKLLIEVAEAAAQCGVKEFVIDAGWCRNEFSPANDGWAGTVRRLLDRQTQIPQRPEARLRPRPRSWA